MDTANPTFSIIVCTFNPDERIFSRTLNAIAALNLEEGMEVECIVVDNNSFPAIFQFQYVQDFLKQCPWAKLIVELKQGLSPARIAGVNASSAPVIIFFDDDNEPAKDYLIAVYNCFKFYPKVAVWGPGQVNVEFVDPVPDWFARDFSKMFQARNIPKLQYGCVSASWQPFYPPGIGQVVQRAVFNRYLTSVKENLLTATGRKGKSMSSAEDIQIVWEAVKLGFSAGQSPDLQINHLIPARRTTMQYIKRLEFGVASSYPSALVESFPETQEEALEVPSNLKIIAVILKKILKSKYGFQTHLIIADLASYLGAVVGTLRARKEKREWINYLVKQLNLE